jgi:predicted transcriptional regulator
MSMTITIELPDGLAERLRVEAEAQGRDVAALARDAITAVYGDEDDEGGAQEPDPELIAALREGLSEEETDRLVTLEEAQAHFDAAFAARGAQERRQKQEAA